MKSIDRYSVPRGRCGPTTSFPPPSRSLFTVCDARMELPLLTPEDGPLPLRDLFPDDAWTAKLAVAPGTVYGNRWEQMATNARPVSVVPVPYEPPFVPVDSSPRCYLDLRSGGVSLGRVVVELRPDAAPLAARNFEQLCAYGVYKGAIFHRIFADFCVQGGDYNQRCGMVCDTPDACFDLSQVTYTEGGRSIYSDRSDGTFADEYSDLRHARGSVSMSNRGRPDSNGSQFFFCITPPDAPPEHLDGKYTVFGQVLEGYSILAALSSVARKDGTTLQRVVCEGCGVMPPASRRAAGVSTANSRMAVVRCAASARAHRKQTRVRQTCCARHSGARVLML